MSTRPSLAFTSGDLAAAFCVVLVWGLNFVAMKLGLRDFSAWQLGALRYVCAALPWVLFIRPPKIAVRWWVIYGLLQGVGQFGFLFTALQIGMTAALASVLMQTQIFFTAFFSYIVLREGLGVSLRVGLVCATVGILCFSMEYVGDHTIASAPLLAFVFNLGAAAMWAAANVVAKRAQRAEPQFDALGFVVWSSIVPIVPFILGSLLLDPAAWRWQWIDARLSSWLAVVYLGWFATVLAYALWTRLLMRHSANRVAPFSLGVPIIGLAAGVIALDETISAWQWLGIIFVVLALGIVLLGPQLAAKRYARMNAATAPTRDTP